MRKYGEINGVSFSDQGFSIYNLAYEYKLRSVDGSVLVYANSMAELRAEISKFIGEAEYEPGEVPVRSLSHIS